jgi:hypothetical protein
VRAFLQFLPSLVTVDTKQLLIGNYRASLEEFDELGFEDIFKDQPLKYQRNVAVCSWVDAVMPKAGNFYDQIPENETTAQEALKLMAAGFVRSISVIVRLVSLCSVLA